MGASPPRVAGVERDRRLLAARARRRGHRSILGACRLAGATVVYRMGGAQAIAALAYGTETVDAGRRDRRPRQPLRPGGQAPGLRPGRDRRVRRPERPDGDRRRRRLDPSRSRSTCSPRPSTAPGSLVVGDLGLGRAARRAGRADRAASPTTRRVVPAGAGRRADAGARALRGVRARAPAADRRRRPRRWRRAITHAGCVFVGPTPAPRSATTSPAPTTCCRPTARRASPRRCRRSTSGGGSPRCGSATARRAGARRRADRPRRGLRAPRPVDGGTHPRQWHER